MPIRIKNLDLNSDGMKRSDSVYIGDVTATRPLIIWAAPVACVVNSIDVYSKEAIPPAGTTASTTLVTIVARLASNSDSTLQSRGTSATAITSNSISANSRYRLIPSANNSLTVGAALELMVSQGGSGTLSAAIVVVNYTPLLHRESR